MGDRSVSPLRACRPITLLFVIGTLAVVLAAPFRPAEAVPAADEVGLTIAVTTDAGGQPVVVGDPVRFTYEVTSLRPRPVDHVGISDDTCAPVTYRSGDRDGDVELDPDETWEFGCTVPLLAGRRTTAIAVGFEVDGGPTVTATGHAELSTIARAPGLALERSVDDRNPAVGQRITYRYVLSNRGNTTIEDVSVVEETIGYEVLQVPELAPGASVTELTSYTIQAGDAGTLIPSRAEATGRDGPNEVRAVANDDVWVPDAPVPIEGGGGSSARGEGLGSDQPAMVLAANQGPATTETIGRFDRDPYLDTFLVVLGVGVIGGLVALGMAKRHYRSHPA